MGTIYTEQHALDPIPSRPITNTLASSDFISIHFHAESGSSSALPTNSGAVRLYALGDCLVEFGDSSVSANSDSMYMPAGTEIFGTTATHIAVKGVGESGLLTVTGLDSSYKHVYSGTNAALPVEAGSSAIELPSGTSVRLFSMTDCFIEFGDASVTATNNSMFFEAGTEVITVPSAATHIAVKRYTLNGGLYISGVN